MAAAKTVQASTLDFLLTDTAGLDVADCLLAMVAALTADGHFDATRSLLALALKKKVPAVDLREAILQTSHIAGPFRARQALEALEKTGSETARPKDAFASLMGDSGSGPADKATRADPDPEDGEADARRRARGAELFGRVHKGDPEALPVAQSEVLSRWLKDDLYGRVFGRPRLHFNTRLLIAIGALVPMGHRKPLADFVKAAKAHGFKKTELWHLHGLLRRLFNETRELDQSEKAFGDVLGARKRDEFAPGKDPFRWD